MADAPKLITLQAPTVRTLRTLIWLQSQDPSVAWKRWDGVVVGLEAYQQWKDIGHITCLIQLNISTDEDWVALYEAAKKVAIVFIPQHVLSQKTQEYWDENFDNVLNLDHLIDSYPFIQTTWNGTAEDAVEISAIMCRYRRLVDGAHTVHRNRPELRREWNIQPPALWLFTQFFTPPSKLRKKEIKECLQRNLACPWIDRVVLLNERDESAAWSKENSSAIQQVVIGHRLRYGDFLRYVQSDAVPEGVIVALCNADIYMHHEAKELWSVDLEDRMLALLRWDDAGQGPHTSTLFGPRADSQDTWIFSSSSVKRRDWRTADVDFLLGQPGCDNAFAGVMMRNRFIITNPAMSVKSYHLHNSNIRTYDKKDYIRSPLYINLVPTYLIDTHQEIVPKGAPQCICNETATIEIKSSSLSNEITYCTMLEKEGRFKWEPQVENFMFEPALPIYKWNNAAVTSNGLVYDLYSIYTGRHAMTEDARFNYWKDAGVNLFTEMHPRDRMIAIPLQNAAAIFASFEQYILYYLSRVLRILREYPGSSFWVPTEYKDQIASLFSWEFQPEQMVPYDGTMACWGKEVVGFLPGPSVSEIAREEVEELRSGMKVYDGTADEQKVCLVVMDGTVLTESFVHTILSPLIVQHPGWSVRTLSTKTTRTEERLLAFLGASLCICVGGKGNVNYAAWALPHGARVVEFQQELKLDGESQHLYAMANTKPWVMLLSKGTPVDVQDQLVTQWKKWCTKNGM